MEDGINVFLFVILGVMIGGHLLYALTKFHLFPKLFEKVTLSIWIARFQYIFGGSVFYGGLFGGLFVGILGTKILRLNTKMYLDFMSPIIPLFHAIARIGCFFGGCCYGIESSFGFTAHSNIYVEQVNDICRFPVQLLESGCNLILCLVLFRLLHHLKDNSFFKGRLIFVYLISYGFIRFFDEFLRGDVARGRIGMFSTSQWISIVSVSISTILILKEWSKFRKTI